ncbi:hypothetical protein [Armatimonas rosea]|uniref:GH16 domain-containing protein n=1 Tax=Armatimonas rosea TaxID=685828 RepID=A0A7W9SS12_ARMRO|nr:hypothetical protein [Armatimonas rosea]MBB6050939.1 hypothetical protein [Armatimonas rosea]
MRKSATLPEGPGLAAAFPGDRGIARHPSVVLAEDFENATLASLGKTWSDISNKGGKPLVLETDPGTRRRVLKITATLGQDSGGHLFTLLPQAAETLFARFYVRFEPDADYIHHFVWMGGHNPGTRWPNPQAGSRPQGDDRVAVGIEPYGDSGRFAAPGAWNFYTYWHEMKKSGDGKFWGAAIAPETKPLLVPRGRWQCVEFMIKLNSRPEKSDGALALWLDGKLAMHVAPGVRRGPWTGLGFTLPETGGEPFEGFRWRTSKDLLLNYFWLEHYVTEEALRRNKSRLKPTNAVWFDDIVVASEYIGPRS